MTEIYLKLYAGDYKESWVFLSGFGKDTAVLQFF